MEKTAVPWVEVLRSWNRCHGAFFHVSESDAHWNLSEQRLLRYWSEEIDGVPVLWAEAAHEGKELGILEHGLWLSLYGEIAPGKEARFAAEVEARARGLGKKRLAIGSDEFHFLPGIPAGEEADDRVAKAFLDRGFSSAGCADYVGAPANPACAEYIAEAAADAGKRGWSLGLVVNAADKDELDAFLRREFSGRWYREWLVWGRRKDTDRAFWNLLRDEKGIVLGFSRLARRGRFSPVTSGWTPGALRLPLRAGEPPGHTDSCLGPIGISAAERGRGAGKILLGLSLQKLSLQGAELTCIDWTNAYNYYTPLDFQIVRRFLSVWRELQVDPPAGGSRS